MSDLPIVLREVPGMLHPPESVLTLFDVGGDDVGARVLSSFRPLRLASPVTESPRVILELPQVSHQRS